MNQSSAKSKPELFIFAGPNGSGKTTLYYKRFANTRLKGIEYVNPDEYAKLHGGELAGGKEAVKRRKELINDMQSFVTETTLSGKGPIRLIEQASKAGFRITLIYIGSPSPNLNIERVKHRVARGGHHVKSDDIKRRYTDSLNNLQASIEKVATAHVFTTNAVTKRIFSTRAGNVRPRQGVKIPAWVPESLKKMIELQNTKTRSKGRSR